MKNGKTLKRLCCAALCFLLLAGMIPSLPADAASDRLESLAVYYEYLKDEVAGFGGPIQDEGVYKFYSQIEEGTASTKKILHAYLLDMTGDGIEELFLKRYITYGSDYKYSTGDCEWIAIYTCENGRIKRIGQTGDSSYSDDEPIIEFVLSNHEYPHISDDCIYYCTGTEGKAYLTNDHPTGMADETRRFYSFTGSRIENTKTLKSDFVPDWYVSPGIHSSYGRYDYYVDGVKVSHAQFERVRDGIVTSFTELVNNDYRTVLSSLESQLQAYYTPSSWAAVEVNMAINNGYVPRELQRNYTKAITRAEFCSLATLLYETVTGKEISEREYFNDCSELSVQKMGALGIVTGTGNGNFSPNNNLTRQEAATILGRLAVALNMQTGEQELSFADNELIAEWAKPSVSKLLAPGVMGGVGNNMFDPLGSYTREQAIMTIVRLSQLPIGDPVPVSGISLSPASLSLTVGDEADISAAISPADATEKKLSWTSSDESTVTVDKNGHVTAVGEGSATVTAEAPSGVSAKCTVTVGPVKSTGIKLDRSEAFLNVGKSLQLNAKLYPEDASTLHISWTSSDESIATVSSTGIVTAFKEGSVTITAESFGESASCTVTVSTAPLGLENFVKNNVYTGQFTDVASGAWFAPNVAAAYEYGLMTGSTATTFNPGGNLTLAEALVIACRIHDIYYDNGHDFSGGNPWYQGYVDYAIDNGIIFEGEYKDFTATAARMDFATILAACVPAEALAPINNVGDGLMNDVPDLIPDVPAENFSFAPAVYLLYNAGILSGSNSYGDFQPTSSITRAEVSAIITRIADPSLRRSFTLVEKEIPAQNMFFLIEYEGMRIGETFKIEPAVFPTNSTWKDIVWTSSDPSVVSVDGSGLVTAEGPGSATITATLRGLSASYEVNVAREDIVYSGSGRERIKIDVPQGAWKVEYTHDSTRTGSFIVKGTYETQKIIQDAGDCSGVGFFRKAIEEDVSGYDLEISASGDWTLRFVEVNELISSNLSGTDSCVPGLIYCTASTTVTASYTGSDYFSVDIYSLKDGQWEWAVGEIGPFENETKMIFPQKYQLYVVHVEGDGSWTVDFGYGDERVELK